jgi:Rrf2 family protein
MRLTRASSYALTAAAYMAGQKKNGPTASHVIAKKRGIPERFLLKVLKPLVSAQVLFSVKGPHGGYRLARPATEISLLEILEAVDGPLRGYAPVNHGEGSTYLMRRLEQICKDCAEQLRRTLAKIMLSDLASRD